MTEILPNGLELAVAKQLTEETIPFVARMGLTVEHMEPGYVRLRAPIEGNGNHFGVMYAGALYTLAEIPGGALAVATFDVKKFYPLVKEMTVKFLKPATTDVTVDARISPEEVERIGREADATGRSEFILAHELVDANGVVVMTSRGIYQLRAWPKPPEETA